MPTLRFCPAGLEATGNAAGERRSPSRSWGTGQARFHASATGLLAHLPRSLRRVDRAAEAALAELSKKDRTAKKFLEDRDGEPDLVRLLAGRLPTPDAHELVEIRLPVRGRAVHLRRRDVLL